jgi:hypothetical protein
MFSSLFANTSRAFEPDCDKLFENQNHKNYRFGKRQTGQILLEIGVLSVQSVGGGIRRTLANKTNICRRRVQQKYGFAIVHSAVIRIGN